MLPALHTAADSATEDQPQQQPDPQEQQQLQAQGSPEPQQQQQQQWLCAGIGKACVGRAEMFRLQHGVAVQLTQRVYDVPSLNGGSDVEHSSS